VLNLAREDIVWHSVSELITDVPDKEMLGLNIVEFAGDDAELIDQQVTTLCQRLDELMARAKRALSAGRSVTIWTALSASTRCVKKPSACWGMPKGPQADSFAEDTCVPPEHLADYIVEFRALLDSHGLSYGMFGHVDAGVLHVRRWICAIRSRRC
jgi:FAD/FMN-containing dehydrogenase